jgi:hypothetical protein
MWAIFDETTIGRITVTELNSVAELLLEQDSPQITLSS